MVVRPFFLMQFNNWLHYLELKQSLHFQSLLPNMNILNHKQISYTLGYWFVVLRHSLDHSIKKLIPTFMVAFGTNFITDASFYNDSSFNEFSLKRTQTYDPVFIPILSYVIASPYNEWIVEKSVQRQPTYNEFAKNFMN